MYTAAVLIAPPTCVAQILYRELQEVEHLQLLGLGHGPNPEISKHRQGVSLLVPHKVGHHDQDAQHRNRRPHGEPTALLFLSHLTHLVTHVPPFNNFLIGRSQLWSHSTGKACCPLLSYSFPSQLGFVCLSVLELPPFLIGLVLITDWLLGR
jgi:hypothetical protein